LRTILSVPATISLPVWALPLLFGFGVDAVQCGLNEMHIKLSRLGFSVSVD